jgi:monothiol glutaredoxin
MGQQSDASTWRPRQTIHLRTRFMSEQAVHDWMPQCGFSAQVAHILGHLGVDYKDVNVLEDMSIRDGIKSFSSWPTIPQLYVKGEFIGGCDIVREMFQANELQQLLNEKGITQTSTMTA